MTSFPSTRRLPLVNLNVMGTRPECIVPDGVWIEVQPNVSSNEAAKNAQVEEMRIANANNVRDDRLKKFQKDVQRRVSRAANAQRSDMVDFQSRKVSPEKRFLYFGRVGFPSCQVEVVEAFDIKSCQSGSFTTPLYTKTVTPKMKHEIDVLYRSASAAEHCSPKKNRCSYNVNPIAIDCTGKIAALDISTDQATGLAKPELDNQAKLIETQARKARMKLAKNLLAPEPQIEIQREKTPEFPLPGGIWATGCTRDKSAARLFPEDTPSPIDEEASQLLDEVQTIPAVSAPDHIALTSVQEGIVLDNSEKNQHMELQECDISQPDQDVIEEGYLQLPQAHPSSKIPNVVHFNKDNNWQSEPVKALDVVTSSSLVSKPVPDGDTTSSRTEVLGKQKLGVERNFPPVLHPGAVKLDEKKALERARWLSRRVFADAERERTREQARMKEHKIRADRIRNAKEQEREEVERKLREKIEAAKIAEKQKQKQTKIDEKKKEKVVREKRKREQKQERFIAAMKSQLKERVELNKLELPPLCQCAATFWQTDPMTCANNCLFYRNHEAYTKALEAVLEAVERNLLPFHKHALQRSTVTLGLVGDLDEGGSLFSARRSARSQASTARSDTKENE